MDPLIDDEVRKSVAAAVGGPEDISPPWVPRHVREARIMIGRGLDPGPMPVDDLIFFGSKRQKELAKPGYFGIVPPDVDVDRLDLSPERVSLVAGNLVLGKVQPEAVKVKSKHGDMFVSVEDAALFPQTTTTPGLQIITKGHGENCCCVSCCSETDDLTTIHFPAAPYKVIGPQLALVQWYDLNDLAGDVASLVRAFETRVGRVALDSEKTYIEFVWKEAIYLAGASKEPPSGSPDFLWTLGNDTLMDGRYNFEIACQNGQVRGNPVRREEDFDYETHHTLPLPDPYGFLRALSLWRPFKKQDAWVKGGQAHWEVERYLEWPYIREPLFKAAMDGVAPASIGYRFTYDLYCDATYEISVWATSFPSLSVFLWPGPWESKVKVHKQDPPGNWYYGWPWTFVGTFKGDAKAVPLDE